MKKLEYKVRFTTPAFLGNAEQSGQWRTPPFKALLRQWWRIVVARKFNYDHKRMREEEGRLFGNAWLEKGSSKSAVRLRLDNWGTGKLSRNTWPKDRPVLHPEVKDGKVPVGSQLYMGYGPLSNQKGTALKANAAIQAAESAALRVAVPDDDAQALRQALSLIDAFGTAGGRSRNGWGSCSIQPTLEGEGNEQVFDLHMVSRHWHEAIELDWPHAIGCDDRAPLIWETRPFGDWQSLMQELARIKIALRTHFKFTTEKNTSMAEARHWLSYPVTNHNVRAWGNFRLPNSLRIKVRPYSHEPTKFVGVLFHVPCRPTSDLRPQSQVLESVWREVHAFLDSANNLTRING